MESAVPGSGQVLANFVGGAYRPAQDGRTSDVVDPSTGEIYLQAPVSGPADVDAALRVAAAAFETWRDTTPAERGWLRRRVRHWASFGASIVPFKGQLSTDSVEHSRICC